MVHLEWIRQRNASRMHCCITDAVSDPCSIISTSTTLELETFYIITIGLHILKLFTHTFTFVNEKNVSTFHFGNFVYTLIISILPFKKLKIINTIEQQNVRYSIYSIYKINKFHWFDLEVNEFLLNLKTNKFIRREEIP